MTADLLAALQALQGEVTLDGRHCYRKAGKVIPGVTSVIKVMDAPALDAWKVRVQIEGTARAAYLETPRENESEDEYVGRLVALAKEEFEHERIANEAADVGKQVHALIEHAIREQLGQMSLAPEASDEALFTFAGWREWATRVRLEPLMAEGRVFHSRHEYAGCFDLLCKIAGRLAIIDWKPKPKAWPERRLQSAAYRCALNHLGFPALDGYLVSMPRDGGEIEMLQLENGPALDETFAAFLSCLHLYRWQKALEKRIRDEERTAV